MIGHVVGAGETWEAGDPQGGFSVVTPDDIQITSVTSDLSTNPQSGMMPAGIGDSYLAPQIGPGTPYELTTTQAGLQGEYFLSVVVFWPGGGGGMIPVSGVDWVGGAMFPLTLGAGTGTVDAGTIQLIPAP